MMRNHNSRTTLVLTALLFASVGSRAFAQASTSPEEAREIVLIPPSGNTAEDREIAHWQGKIAGKPDVSAYWERLGWAYIAKARRTQDAGFYKLAELTAAAWEKKCGSSPETRLLRGHVCHNLHRFHEAELIARELVTESHSPAAYALLSDALMELGRLDEAVAACQQLANLRPGVESFTRIAHLRLLHGDLPGATDAMQTALRAVPLQDHETRCWIHSRLAAYELLSRRPEQAVSDADAALRLDPQYPPALEMKGRALYAIGKYDEASVFLQRAAESNPIPENLWWWADILRRTQKEGLAQSVEQRLAQFGAAVDQRTLSLFLATRGENPRRAERLAENELLNRGDISTHDAIAFALLRCGKISEAKVEIEKALATNACDARVALHAALIDDAGGDTALAAAQCARAESLANALTPSEQALLASLRKVTVAAAP